MRGKIYEGLTPAEVLPPDRKAMDDAHQLGETFREDKDLRRTSAEVLLLCSLSVEFGRPIAPLLDGYSQEIRKALVCAANLFLLFLQGSAFLHTNVQIDRGSPADAWIYLFAEFREELGKAPEDWWWRPKYVKHLPYVSW